MAYSFKCVGSVKRFVPVPDSVSSLLLTKGADEDAEGDRYGEWRKGDCSECTLIIVTLEVLYSTRKGLSGVGERKRCNDGDTASLSNGVRMSGEQKSFWLGVRRRPFLVGVRISGEAVLFGVRISGEAVFIEVRISGEAVFVGVRISGDAVLIGVRISEWGVLGVRISGDAFLIGVRISGDAFLLTVRISGEAFLLGVGMEPFGLRITEAGEPES